MSGPSPATAAVRRAVREDLALLRRECSGRVVLVACSGGADSLALAAGAAFAAARSGFATGAVVVDHGLQPGSAAVAEAAAGQCRGLGLEPVDVVAVAVGRAGGPEAAARDARYAALEAAAVAHGAEAVLLAHTRDDQAESVLLGLARGSGARSLAGMPAVRGRWRRPLLELPRSVVRAACADAGLVPWEDPANADAALARARVRHRVLPVLEAELGPGAAAALARTARALRDDADALDALTDALAASAVRVEPAGGASAAVADLAAQPAALRRRLLRRLALAAGAPAGALAAVHVDAADALLLDWRGQGPVALPGGLELRRSCGRLRVERGARPREPLRARTPGT
ncbi:tRNA(Ile)-lysidine synthase [Kineococcus xinjiangensis]|uniref:tRNA(Ile)-lysidine synthase n=1 Tax=Kineococcus xinjiangensis TaxID=512762 RepID=A0A2S6IGT6_9ACTN|nr:tRNA lysidine(34) synthetase TilS [Kineococcus xinjiangensis]PPK93428.1 tRNA(Ile)-lysidine synthase [Kineococcus xinjiangensis]